MKIIRKLAGAALLLLAACAAAASAQPVQVPAVEFGSLEEVGGGRVFVYSEDLSARQRICKELSKHPWLTVASRKEDADLTLLYTARADAGPAAGGDDAFTYSGELTAVKFVEGPYGPRARILFYTRKQRKVRTIPLGAFAPAPAAAPAGRSAKGALLDLVVRLAVEAAQRRRAGTRLNALSNTLTVSRGKPEHDAVKQFLREWKKAREARPHPAFDAAPRPTPQRFVQAPPAPRPTRERPAALARRKGRKGRGGRP